MTNGRNSPPVIITGMHRSGTSMVSSFLQALGVDIGSRLITANAHNARGYFEDRDFVGLHRDMFRAACPANESGWVDVGYSESERLDMGAVASFTDAARQLIAMRRSLVVWGWKDPRTTLLLPFWDDLLPEARYVLIYRYPWDVADSLYRRGDTATAERPELAYRIWLHYNRHLLAFYQQRRDRCVLINANALPAHLDGFGELLANRLGLPLAAGGARPAVESLFEPQLMCDLPLSHPTVALVRAQMPDMMAMLQALDDAADLPSPLEASAPPAVSELHLALVLAENKTRKLELLAAEVKELQDQNQQLARDMALEVAAQRATVQAMLRSTSWRLTAPLRAISTALRSRH